VKLPRWIPLLGRFLPPGIAEAFLALYVLAAWINIDLYGPRTPSDVIALVGLEAGLLLLGGMGGLLLSSAPLRDGIVVMVHLGVWSLVFARWVFETVGWLSAALILVRLGFLYFHALSHRGGSAVTMYKRHYSVPLIVLLAAAFVALLAPVPYLDWSYYDVPPEARVFLEDAPWGVPNWFPATGFLYFGGLAFVRLMPWREPNELESAREKERRRKRTRRARGR